jgi:hypothetical protein
MAIAEVDPVSGTLFYAMFLMLGYFLLVNILLAILIVRAPVAPSTAPVMAGVHMSRETACGSLREWTRCLTIRRYPHARGRPAMET